MEDSLYIFAHDSAEVQAVSSHFVFDPDTTLHLQQVYLAPGERGSLQPYNVSDDNVLTLALIACFVIVVLSLAISGRLLVRQAKEFFFSRHSDEDEVPENRHFHVAMLFINCFLLAVGSYIFAKDWIAHEFVIEYQPLVVAIFFGAFFAYFAVKWLAYSFVNSIFFGSKKRLQWNHDALFLTSLEALLLFPLVLLLVYFDLSLKNSLIYFGVVLILNKMLTFYKCSSIFFRQKGLSLQNFLYFCALEMMPLFAFAGIWLALVNLLKVNF